MKLSVQDLKDRTDELATRVQTAQLQRQEILLSIPSVILQIASEMSLAIASNQNGLLNLFTAVLVDGKWTPISEIPQSDARKLANELLASMNHLYPQIVEERSVRGSRSQGQAFSSRKMAGVFRTVVFSDMFLKDFYCEAESCDESEISSAFMKVQRELKRLCSEMMAINEGAFKSIIRPYLSGSCSDDDIRAEGYAGFFRACLKYIPDGRSGFYGMVKYWVVARVVRFVDKDSSRLSIHSTSGTLLRRIRKARQELRDEGKVVSLSQVAKHLDMTIEDISLSDQAFGNFGEYNDVQHGDALVRSGFDPLKSAQDESDQRFVREMMKALSHREANVLVGRYGLGCSPKTLQELGESLGVSLEAVRQIQARAEKKLAGMYGGR